MPNANKKKSNRNRPARSRSANSRSSNRGGAKTGQRSSSKGKVSFKGKRNRSSRLSSGPSSYVRGISEDRRGAGQLVRTRSGIRSLSSVQSVHTTESLQFAGAGAIKGKIAGARLSPYAANILLNITLPFDSKPVRLRAMTDTTSISNSALFKNYNYLTLNYSDYTDVDVASLPVIGELYTGFSSLYADFPTNIYAVNYRNPYITMSYPEATGAYLKKDDGTSKAMFFVSQASATPDYVSGKGFQLPTPTKVGDTYIIDTNITFSCPRWSQSTSYGSSTSVVLDDMVGVPAVIDGQNYFLPWFDIPNNPSFASSNQLNCYVTCSQYQSILANSLELVVDKYLPTSSRFLAVGRTFFNAAGVGEDSVAQVHLGSLPDGTPNDASSGYYRISVIGHMQSSQNNLESYFQGYCLFQSYSSIRTKYLVNPHFPVASSLANKGRPLISNSQIIGSAFLFQNQTPEMFKGGNVCAVQPSGNLSWSRYTSDLTAMTTDNYENRNFYNGNFDVGLYGFVKPIKNFGFRPSFVLSGDNVNYPFCPGIIQTPQDKGDGFSVTRITPPIAAPGAPIPQCTIRVQLACIYEGTTDSQLFNLDAPFTCPDDLAAVSSHLVRFSGFCENPFHLPTIVKGIGNALKKGVHWLSDNKDWISAGLDAVMNFF